MRRSADKLINELISVGQYFASKSWLPASSGNFSVRCGEDGVLITASGKQKGNLTKKDFVLLDMQAGAIEEDSTPSAEALLHTQLYKFSQNINAVFHIHSINSVLISSLFEPQGKVILENYELLKALSSVRGHEHREVVPIFANNQNIQQLASLIEKFLDTSMHGYLIARHGLYSWGRDIEEAKRHIECLETLFSIEILRMQLEKNLGAMKAAASL